MASIRAQLSQQPHGPCHLKTSGGNVEVSLAADIGLQVDARTSGGRVSTDFPVVTQGTLDKNSLKASINGGGPLMTLRTSGRVHPPAQTVALHRHRLSVEGVRRDRLRVVAPHPFAYDDNRIGPELR